MTDSGFDVPLVEKVLLPGTKQEFEWRVSSALNDKKLNMVEKVKAAKPGLSVLDDLDTLAEEARRKGGAQYIEDQDDLNMRLKWLGLFHRQKHAPGTFMWRMRCPNGIFSSQQWRALYEVVRQYETGSKSLFQQQGCLSITTRQNIQLYGIRLEDLPRHVLLLNSHDVFSIQTGMDNVRNVVGNPLAGIDPEELIDTRRFCSEFTASLTKSGKGNADFTNLPRKFNVCFVGSKHLFEHPDINDISYIPARDHQGNLGWNVNVGGLLSSSRCEFAAPLDAWVPLEGSWEVGASILSVFRDWGYRYNPRTKSRLAFLLDDMGAAAFREEVGRRYSELTGTRLQGAGSSLVPSRWERREVLGVHKQKDGRNWLGVHVPVGRIYPDELLALIELSEEFGEGEMRMTVEGNLIIPHVEDSKVSDAVKALEQTLPSFSLYPQPLLAGTVACTGSQFCGQSKINTKGHARRMAEELDRELSLPRPVRIHWTGCPNTCGQVQLGDIGLLGTVGRDSSGQAVEAVDVYLGGGVGQEGSLGRLYKQSVCVEEELKVELRAILMEKFGATRRQQ